MTCREWIEIILAISSFICALVSIIIVIVTIRQNNKMLEESTRPVIAIYSRQMHNGNMPIGYLVVRNYGQSAATINKFDYDFDFSKAYKPEYATVHNKKFYNCGYSYPRRRQEIIHLYISKWIFFFGGFVKR